jgi:hypothetical protein
MTSVLDPVRTAEDELLHRPVALKQDLIGESL